MLAAVREETGSAEIPKNKKKYKYLSIGSSSTSACYNKI
jgi:hypothetical protein